MLWNRLHNYGRQRTVNQQTNQNQPYTLHLLKSNMDSNWCQILYSWPIISCNSTLWRVRTSECIKRPLFYTETELTVPFSMVFWCSHDISITHFEKMKTKTSYTYYDGIDCYSVIFISLTRGSDLLITTIELEQCHLLL